MQTLVYPRSVELLDETMHRSQSNFAILGAEGDLSELSAESDISDGHSAKLQQESVDDANDSSGSPDVEVVSGSIRTPSIPVSHSHAGQLRDEAGNIQRKGADLFRSPFRIAKAPNVGQEIARTTGQAIYHESPLSSPASSSTESDYNPSARTHRKGQKKKRKLTGKNEFPVVLKKRRACNVRPQERTNVNALCSGSQAAVTVWPVRTDGGDMFNRSLILCDK